jgi:hypothetical protein
MSPQSAKNRHQQRRTERRYAGSDEYVPRPKAECQERAA